MNVLIINSVCGIKSTGRIATDIAGEYLSKGDNVVVAYGRDSVPQEYQAISKRITSEVDVRLNGVMARLFDNDGFNAYIATKRFLDWANEYDPDLLWLHNLHGYYINVELLFDWIKSRPNMEVKWTLHDCWAFTGHCTYFTYAGCNKWQTGCNNCPQKKSYPKSLIFDNSLSNYSRKRNAFTGINKMTIITPSFWLASLVKNSFLKDYPIVVKHNTISSKFKPTESNIREQLGIKDKYMILGVAAQWTERKGLKDFIDLSMKLNDSCSIVLVGLTKKQISSLPDNVIGLEKTNSVEELVELYSAADVFFNPTYEDNYPTTNLESKACGTPVITYNTGGSPESVDPRFVVNPGDLEAVRCLISQILTN